LVLALLVCLCGSASAYITTSNVFDRDATIADKDARVTGRPFGGIPMTGGDVIGTATVIPGLPYQDLGITCGFANNYDEACPYTGSTSPDVVYSYSPATNIPVTIDLCASQYDTKVYVYRNGYTPGSPYACNDDAGCGITGYQSQIKNLQLYAGDTYYIVVDGYGGDCGDYELDVAEFIPCVVNCPPGALQEGEPPCYDDYVDTFNGGCNSTPFVFSLVYPSCQVITLCGTSGTYLYGGSSYRDTDWFQIDLVEESNLVVCCTAEFPLQLLVVNGNHGCPVANEDILASAASAECVEACIAITLPVGRYWLWVGPGTFSGVPCGSDYVMTIGGYGPGYPSGTESSTWGAIKSLIHE